MLAKLIVQLVASVVLICVLLLAGVAVASLA